MNTDKILNIINKEETEYFNKNKKYAVFSKHFSFKLFSSRHFIEVALSSPIFTLPVTFFYRDALVPLNYGALLFLSFSLFTFILYYFIFYALYRSYFKIRFLRTKKYAEQHESFLRKTLMNDFNEQKINDTFLNYLKIELSEEQYIELMSENLEPTYKNVKDLVNKEIITQRIKYSQKHITLTSDEIEKYSKNKAKVKLHVI